MKPFIGSYLSEKNKLLKYFFFEGQKDKEVLVYFNGLQGHAEYFFDIAERLNKFGYNVYLLDRRGSGINKEIPTWDRDLDQIFYNDIKLFWEHINKPPIILMGYSLGGKLAIAVALKNIINCTAIILFAPAIFVKVSMKINKLFSVVIGIILNEKKLVEVPINDNMITNNAEYIQRMVNDPYRIKSASCQFYLAILKMDFFLKRKLSFIKQPIFMLMGEQDKIINNQKILKKILKFIPKNKLKIKIYSDTGHDLILKQENNLGVEIKEFIEKKGF
jgi:alpha-beta hydrolase superfamily lysophospholipase